MHNKTKKLQRIYIIYWLMLAYTFAALVFWFISLWKQNDQMITFKLEEIRSHPSVSEKSISGLQDERKRKSAQYIGEGITFFLVIMAGAIVTFRAVRRQLKQSQLQQNFMMAITHELKTPIAVAHLNLETLIKRKLDESQQQRLIQNTLQETSRMNALCNNMLLSSQIDAGGYRMVNDELDLSELSEKSVQEFTNRFPKKELTMEIQKEVFVNGDVLLLQMAVNNLVDNAIKYSAKDSPVKISLQQEGNDVVFSVADQGIGISEADKKKVFEKFYRAGNDATRSARGTGLGLYLTLRVIEAHHASIEIKDNHPAGTIFIAHFNAAV